MAKVPELRFATIAKNGSSRGVNIPRQLLEQLHWRDGTPIEMWLQGDCLVLSAAVSRRSLLERQDAVKSAVHGPRREKVKP